MPEGDPGWLYIGNGLLQYKDIDGWTDRYQELDDPARNSAVAPLASTDDLGSGIGKAGQGAHDPGLLTRLCSSAAYHLIVGFRRLMVGLWHLIVGLSRLMVTFGWPLIVALSRLIVTFGRRVIAGFWRLIAEGYRQASASLSIRSVARRQRGPSKSSVLVDEPSVLVDEPIALMKRSSGEHPHRKVPRHRSRIRLRPGQSEEEAELLVYLDPQRLNDMIPVAAGADQRVSFPGRGIGTKPLEDG